MNFIELQFDDFTLESFDRFWYEVDRLDDKNVVLLLDPEAATRKRLGCTAAGANELCTGHRLPTRHWRDDDGQ